MSLQPTKIKSKKSIGVKPVYDICVPGAHHYLLDSGVVSHNSGFIYASSIVVAMKKLKLKEDEDGNKISEVRGIRSACKVMKTRYAKPFESVQVKIPYDQGMSPYSGLTDLIEAKGLLKKEGNSLVYVTRDGEIIKKFRKGWERNDDGCLDLVMQEIMKDPATLDAPVAQTEEEITDGQ
jgi:hypothetical protein